MGGWLWVVGGGWAVIVASALLHLFLIWDFESRIKKFEQRWAGSELDKVPVHCCLFRKTLSFLRVTRLDSNSNQKIVKLLCLVDLWVFFLITCSLNFIAIIFAYVKTFLSFIIKTVLSLLPCFFAALSIPIQNTLIIILLIFCFTTAD